jgi:hypothetical protein
MCRVKAVSPPEVSCTKTPAAISQATLHLFAGTHAYFRLTAFKRQTEVKDLKKAKGQGLKGVLRNIYSLA